MVLSWIDAVVPILRKKMTCAQYIGRTSQYLHSAIMLFALAATDHLSKYEKEELHRDILSIISAQGAGASTQLGSFFSKPEFASSVPSGGAPVEYCLTNNYMIELSESTYSNLFDVKVRVLLVVVVVVLLVLLLFVALCI